MMKRIFLRSIAAATLALCCSVAAVSGAERPAIEHPIKNPQRYTDHVRCDNCGMDRNKWSRTRYEFSTSKGKVHTCSIACTVVMAMKLSEQPAAVMVAEYLRPERMLRADMAVFVIGSSAPGTMTRISKIAFESKREADSFAARYGGKVAGFEEALAAARAETPAH